MVFAELPSTRAERIRHELKPLVEAYFKNSHFLTSRNSAALSTRFLNVSSLQEKVSDRQLQADRKYVRDLSMVKGIPAANGILFPRSTAEVQKIVQFAIEHNYKIRIVGASHSPKASIYDPQDPHQLIMHLEGDLRKIESIQTTASKEYALVRTGAGCYLGVNTADKTSTLNNSFNYQIDQAGYALPTLGGISHQTIAGFLQTSSSGGTAFHTIAEVVEAIEWVDGRGQIRQAKRGDKEFNAVMVSMGLFGVVTHVTLKLPRKYLVEGNETNHEYNDSVLVKNSEGHYAKLQEALFYKNEYVHINWLPQKYVNRTMEWTGKQTTNVSLPIKPYEHPLSNKVISHLATLVFRIGNLIDEYGASENLRKIKAEMLKLFCNPMDKQEFRDSWFKTLPIDDQADVDGDIHTLFSELWFPVEQLDEVMKRLENLFQENPKAAGNFIVELYCAKESPYWLSPSYGHPAFRVDLYWWNKNIGDPNTYFGIFWNKLLTIPGARMHWGKYLPIPGKKYGNALFTAKQLSINYPHFEEWQQLREEMDPHQIFVTDYWRQVLNIK